MKTKSRLYATGLAGLLLFGTLIGTMAAFGANLGNVLKGAGIAILVDKFSDEINNTINKLTLNKGVGVEDRTKVVPIISIGQGGYVGAVQVSGPAHLVEKVKAVAQLETSFSGRTFRIKALVPVESKDVVKDLKRVSGVGVSAIIDVRL
ncbi:MAG: hypothetical protein K6T99_05145 [Armatimonadetes bacterium]|nr:hypothetical protein [Armatimonadota bacterium]